MSKHLLEKQCMNCYAWYTNLKGFSHHIRHCRRSNDGKTSDKVEHHIAHPMLSIHSTSSVFASRRYFEKDDESAQNGLFLDACTPAQVYFTNIPKSPKICLLSLLVTDTFFSFSHSSRAQIMSCSDI